MLRVKERMKVEFSRSITLSVLALFHRTGHALKMVLTNRYTCTPQRRLFFNEDVIDKIERVFILIRRS